MKNNRVRMDSLLDGWSAPIESRHGRKGNMLILVPHSVFALKKWQKENYGAIGIMTLPQGGCYAWAGEMAMTFVTVEEAMQWCVLASEIPKNELLPLICDAGEQA